MNTAEKKEGAVDSQCALFTEGAVAVYVEYVLLEVVGTAEVLAAQGAGEGVARAEAAALVARVPRQGGARPVAPAAHDALETQAEAAADVTDAGLLFYRCEHTQREAFFQFYGLGYFSISSVNLRGLVFGARVETFLE